jgi:hypothetical protein
MESSEAPVFQTNQKNLSCSLCSCMLLKLRCSDKALVVDLEVYLNKSYIYMWFNRV